MVLQVEDESHQSVVHFARPDERATRSYQHAAEFVQFGAVCLACLIMPDATGLRVARVTEHGSNADYFLADEAGSVVAVLEVGGTDDGALPALRTAKLSQVGGSYWRRKPHSLRGYAAVVRFAEPAAAAVSLFRPTAQERV